DLPKGRVTGTEPEKAIGAEALHEDARLDDHDATGKERGEHHDGQRQDAHLVQVAQELATIEAQSGRADRHVTGQEPHSARFATERQRSVADGLQGAQRGAHQSGPSNAPRTNWRTTGSSESAISLAGPSYRSCPR